MRRAIWQSGRTQRDIAAEIDGLTESRLSLIVNGLHADEGTRSAIARALNVNVLDLWPESGPSGEGVGEMAA